MVGNKGIPLENYVLAVACLVKQYFTAIKKVLLQQTSPFLNRFLQEHTLKKNFQAENFKKTFIQEKMILR